MAGWMKPSTGFGQQAVNRFFVIAADTQTGRLPDSLPVNVYIKAPLFPDSCRGTRSFDLDIYFRNRSEEVIFLPPEIDVYDDSGIAAIPSNPDRTIHLLKPGEQTNLKIRIFNTQRDMLDKSGHIHLTTQSGDITLSLHIKVTYYAAPCFQKRQ